jgi:hypothetical protein
MIHSDIFRAFAPHPLATTRPISIVLLLAVASGVLLLMGLMGASGTSALAEAAGASPLVPAIDDCTEASAVHSREQNSARKMILMGKTVPWGVRNVFVIGVSPRLL